MNPKYHCFFCGREFEGRPDKYLQSYKISVCYNCLDSNRDGWAPHYTERLKKHLEENDLPIPELKNGSLPQDI